MRPPGESRENMATYHLSMKTGEKGKAEAHSLYVDREGKYSDKPDLEYSESGNMPSWAETPRDFWKAADEYERANGTTYRGIEIALPRELTPEQRIELVQGFVKEHLADHPYTLDIHNPPAAIDGGEQPHAHVMFSERKQDGIERDTEQFFKRANKKEPEKGGAAKAEKWNGKDRNQHLELIRESWAKHQNIALERAGRPERVDHRTLEAQGIDRTPERHLGPKLARMDDNAEIIRELRADHRELADLSKEITALKAELQRHHPEWARVTASPPARVHSQVYETPPPIRETPPPRSPQVAQVQSIPSPQVVELSRDEVKQTLDAEHTRLRGQWDALQKEANQYRATPLTDNQAQAQAWNEVTNGKWEELSTEYQKLVGESNQAKQLAAQLNDRHAKASLIDKKNPYSQLNKDLASFDKYKVELQVRINDHNHRKNTLINDPALKTQVQQRTQHILTADKQREDKHQAIIAQIKPIRERCYKIEDIKVELTKVSKEQTLKVQGRDAQSIIRTPDLDKQIEKAKEIEKERTRTRDRGIER